MIKNFKSYILDEIDIIKDPLQYTGSTVGIIADSEYPKLFSPSIKHPIRDQGPDGKCFAYACIKVMETQHYFETGEMVKLSEDFYYWQKLFKSYIGMIPAFDISTLRKIGTCLKKDFSCVGEWDIMNQYIIDNNIDTQILKSLSSKFRAKTTLTLSLEELSPYLHIWKAGIISVEITESYYKTGIDGIVPMMSGKSFGGHAKYIDELVMINGKLHVGGDNSWTDKWGNKGRFYIDVTNPCIKKYYGIVDANAVTSEVTLTIGSKTVLTSTGSFELPEAPFITDKGNTVIPLRFITEYFGKAVDWKPLDPPQFKHIGSKIIIRMREAIKNLLVV